MCSKNTNFLFVHQKHKKWGAWLQSHVVHEQWQTTYMVAKLCAKTPIKLSERRKERKAVVKREPRRSVGVVISGFVFTAITLVRFRSGFLMITPNSIRQTEHEQKESFWCFYARRLSCGKAIVVQNWLLVAEGNQLSHREAGAITAIISWDIGTTKVPRVKGSTYYKHFFRSFINCQRLFRNNVCWEILMFVLRTSLGVIT